MPAAAACAAAPDCATAPTGTAGGDSGGAAPRAAGSAGAAHRDTTAAHYDIAMNSRKLNNRYYTITFRELDSRLKEYGFCLHNPHKNFIDVCKIEEKKGFLGFGEKKVKLTKITQIGFPNWKKQVSKSDISKVRRATGLVSEKGVDSESFFRGADPLHALIAEYHAPLERLANR